MFESTHDLRAAEKETPGAGLCRLTAVNPGQGDLPPSSSAVNKAKPSPAG